MQQATENGSSRSLSIGDGCRALSPSRSERGFGGLFARVLLPLLHLLDESLCFLLVGEGEPRGTVLKLEGMKEGPVLVISKVIVDLLVPDYTSVHGLP